MKKTIYLFSGLGADERVFQCLDFSDFSVVHIHWIKPDKDETIENYASRMLKQIKSNRPILVGYSFGGIMAIEVAKQIETEKIITIASINTKDELPFYFRLTGKLNLHKLIPMGLVKHSNFFTNWMFGAETKFDKELLKQIIHDTDTQFLKWAIDKVLKWNNSIQIKNLTHIHGTKDRILPYRYVTNNITINNGGHLMLLNKSEELNKIIREIL